MGEPAVVEGGDETAGLADQVAQGLPPFRGGQTAQADDVIGQFQGAGDLFGKQVALARQAEAQCGATPPAVGASAGRGGADRAP